MKKLATRFAQYPLIAEFDFKFNDWVIDSNDGVKKTLGSSVVNSADPAEPLLTGPAANTIAFDCLNLPADAVICGGEVIVDHARHRVIPEVGPALEAAIAAVLPGPE